MLHRGLPSLLAIAAFALAPVVAHGQGTGPPGPVAGITFATLPDADLDTIKERSGYRLGVSVTAVAAASPGAAAGLKPGDVVFAVGKTGVDNAEKAVAALRAATGEIDLAGMTLVDGQFEVKVFRLNLGVAPAAGGDVGAANNQDAALAKATADPIEAYCDMMDFIRAQAWGREVGTPRAERQRIALQVQQGLAQMDAQTQAVLAQIPQAWAAVQQQWRKWDDQQKSKQRSEWYNQLLLPGGLYPAPENAQKYTAPQNLLSFEYPGSWTGGMTEAQGTPLLFLGPGGSEAQWERVLDTPSSPSGALFALAQAPADMRNMSYLQGAHYVARILIPNGLSNLKVLQELPIGDVAAAIVLTGKFPGQAEEKFYWIGVAKFGDSQVFAGRMGGPVKDADKLIPAFTYMLQTLQLNPPQAAGGGGGASGAWQAAWSRVDTAIVKNIWAPSGN